MPILSRPVDRSRRGAAALRSFCVGFRRSVSAASGASSLYRPPAVALSANHRRCDLGIEAAASADDSFGFGPAAAPPTQHRRR